MQTILGCKNAAVGKLPDLGNNNLVLGQKEAGIDDQTGKKIHGRTGNQNDKALPPGCLLEGSGIFRILVLALHGAVTADGDAADGIEGLTHLLFPDGGAHKHGKFIDLNPGELCGDEMAQFMDENQYTKNENRK